MSFLSTKANPLLRPLGAAESLAAKRRKRKIRKENRRKKSRSSSKSSKGSRGSKGSKGSGGSRGSGGRRPKPSLPAAVCLLGALVASSAPQADALAFRKEVPIFHDQCSNAAPLRWHLFGFSNTPEYHYIPTRVEDSNWRGVEIQPRIFTKEHPVKYRPKSDGQDVRDALATAKMLRSTIEAMEQGAMPACKFRCKTEFGCSCCIAPGLSVGCPAKGSQTDPAIEMEWIADTGSAQDLISESMLGEVKEFKFRQAHQHDNGQRS